MTVFLCWLIGQARQSFLIFTEVNLSYTLEYLPFGPFKLGFGVVRVGLGIVFQHRTGEGEKLGLGDHGLFRADFSGEDRNMPEGTVTRQSYLDAVTEPF